MRVTFIIILVLLGVLLGLPYWFGVNAEKEYANLENILESQLESGNIVIIDKSYERGWFSSKAQTTLALTDAEGEILRLRDQDTIYHGPIPLGPLFKGKLSPIPVTAVIDSTSVLIPGPDSEYKELTGKLPPIFLRTALNLDGGGTTDISMPGIDSETGEEGEYIVWSGVIGKLDFGPGFKEIAASIESGGLKIKSEDLNLAVSGLKGDSDIIYQGGDYYLPIGSASLSIKDISLESKDEETGELDSLSLKNIEFKGMTENVAGRLNSVHSLWFEEVAVGKLKYGPGGYELTVRNIDKVAWQKIQKLLNESRNITDPEESREYAAAQIMNILPELVKKSPEIELTKLSLETGAGSLEGHLLISVDGSGLANPDLASNPLFLLMAVAASAELSITKSLLENAMIGINNDEIRDEIKSGKLKQLSDKEIGSLAEQRAADDINQLTSQNILVLEGDRYVLKGEFETGQITLNGTPIDLNSLLGQ